MSAIKWTSCGNTLNYGAQGWARPQRKGKGRT